MFMEDRSSCVSMIGECLLGLLAGDGSRSSAFTATGTPGDAAAVTVTDGSTFTPPTPILVLLPALTWLSGEREIGSAGAAVTVAVAVAVAVAVSVQYDEY